jgi:hypothetical protein
LASRHNLDMSRVRSIKRVQWPKGECRGINSPTAARRDATLIVLAKLTGCATVQWCNVWEAGGWECGEKCMLQSKLFMVFVEPERGDGLTVKDESGARFCCPLACPRPKGLKPLSTLPDHDDKQERTRGEPCHGSTAARLHDNFVLCTEVSLALSGPGTVVPLVGRVYARDGYMQMFDCSSTGNRFQRYCSSLLLLHVPYRRCRMQRLHL